MDVPKKSKRLIIWNGGSSFYYVYRHNVYLGPSATFKHANENNQKTQFAA